MVFICSDHRTKILKLEIENKHCVVLVTYLVFAFMYTPSKTNLYTGSWWCASLSVSLLYCVNHVIYSIDRYCHVMTCRTILYWNLVYFVWPVLSMSCNILCGTLSVWKAGLNVYTLTPLIHEQRDTTHGSHRVDHQQTVVPVAENRKLNTSTMKEDTSHNVVHGS